MKKINTINLNEMLGLHPYEDNNIENKKRGATEVELSQLVPFSNHPFRLYEGDKIGDKYDLSGKTVARYIRIDTLTKELKERLDNNEIPFTSAVDLSFLNEGYQEIVETILEDYSYKMNLKKSEVLKNYAQARNLNYDKAKEVLSGKYFNRPKKVKNFKLKSKLVNKFI